jgi:hypothetical protein
MDLVNALRKSQLSAASDALTAISDGWVVSEHPQLVSCTELDSIYTLRQEHLHSLPSNHASQLAAGIGEFLDGLRLHSQGFGRWFTICGEAEYHFLVFVLAEPERAIGCLRTISQLEVSGERWKELWHSNE